MTAPHLPTHTRSSAALTGLAVVAGVLSWQLMQPRVTFSQTTPAVAPATAIMAEPGNQARGSADTISLTAIPPRLGETGDLKIKPGEKMQVALKVRNASAQTVRIDSSVLDFVLSEDGQTPVAVSETVSNRWSLEKWIVISPSSQVLAPNQLGQVNVVIDVPADALPGGHYAMVVHRPSLSGAKATDDQTIALPSSQVNQQVGSLLYVTVDGPINEEAFIRNFKFPQLTEYGPVPFSFIVENSSDVHIRPQTTVEIYDVFGRKIDQIQLDPKNVFPLMNRDFAGSWNKVWGMGWYKAKVVMSFGNQGKIAMAQTTFWLLPYRLVAAVVGGLVILLVLISLVRRQLAKRRRETQAHLSALEKKVAELESLKSGNAPKSSADRPKN